MTTARGRCTDGIKDWQLELVRTRLNCSEVRVISGIESQILFFKQQLLCLTEYFRKVIYNAMIKWNVEAMMETRDICCIVAEIGSGYSNY